MTDVRFDLAGPLPTGRTVIEASAGTGKTYSIAALVTRYVADDVDIADVLVVTFTRAAASELRDRIRRMMRDAADHLDGTLVGEPWMDVLAGEVGDQRLRRVARLREALTRFDEATITTIHGFCQQAIGQSGIRSTIEPGVELVEDSTDLVVEACRDALVARLLHDPLALSTDDDNEVPTGNGKTVRLPSKIEKYVVQTVMTVLSNPGARCVPAVDPTTMEGRWAELVAEAVRAVSQRQRARRLIGYDRLVTDLRDMLRDPTTGPELAEQLAQRYRLVLVDEFQDTDAPQWDVFTRAFGGHRLITVGDPKQAIYRFRGADVHAYLDAVRGVGHSTLDTNHRSDERLLRALDVLFRGATLGHPEIAFRPVAPASGAPQSALGDGAAIHVRVVPDDPSLPHIERRGGRPGPISTVAVQRIVLADLADRVRDLLDHGTITVPGADPRSVEPRDIAVLVPSQRRASEVAATLRQWGIPAVRARTGSVLSSDAALQWRMLLAALVTPTNARVARAAGLGWFFDLEPASLAGDGESPDERSADRFDTPLAELQQDLARLADRMRTSGVGGFYERWRTESRVLTTILERPNGDRNAADLDHIADLLTAATAGASSEPARVQHALEALIAAADDQTEATMRRIETDDQAVQITTIHSAKGLEYPIVLLPFAWSERPNANRPYVYNDGSERLIDVGSWVAWSDDPNVKRKKAFEERKSRATDEVDGDSLRLCYVAMTRAKHRLEVWWAPTFRANSSAFARLVHDRDGAGPLHNTPPGTFKPTLTVDDTRARLDALGAASAGAIEIADVPIEHEVRRPARADGAAPLDLAVATPTRGPLDDVSWRSWSFTSVTRALAGDSHDTHPGAVTAGGLDEPGDPVDGAIPISVPLADVAGGTTFGVMVHEILEQVDFTSATLADDVLAAVEAGSRRAGLPVDTAQLTSGLLAAIDTPLGPLFDGRALRDIPPGDRLAELTFDLAIDDGAALTSSAAEIGAVLERTLPAADPLRAYGGQLAAELAAHPLAGWLNGSIDAVFRVGSGADARFVVVDYKSNRLHDPAAADPLAAYRPDRLTGAMTHSHYPLQALLYSVAVHRYLGWRLGAAYDPDRHLGGIAYLFVRGMVGAETPVVAGVPHGVFSWRPPAATIVALDALFRRDGILGRAS